MLALALHADDQVWPLTDLCAGHGLMVTPTRNAVVRLLPGLLLTEAEWQLGLSRLQAALFELRARLAEQPRCA